MAKTKTPPNPTQIPIDELMKTFKDRMGRWRTKSLFVEMNDDENFAPLFTLGEYDTKEGHISLKKKYLEMSDISEYNFAKSMLGSIECWEKICSSPVILPHVEQWRKELNMKLASESYQSIRTVIDSTTEDNIRLQAIKIMLGKVDPKGESRPRGRGRPSNKPDYDEDAQDKLDTKDDAKRIGLGQGRRTDLLPEVNLEPYKIEPYIITNPVTGNITPVTITTTGTSPGYIYPQTT